MNMKEEIRLKHKEFQLECNIFVRKYILCQRIVTKLTDAVLEDEVCEEAKIETAVQSMRFFDAVKRNLDIFTALIEQHNKTTDNSFQELVSIENDLTLFTIKQCDISQYTEDTTGECLITNVGDISNGRCYINDLERPHKMSFNFCEGNLTHFPQSGEIFGIKWIDEVLVRAVRSDLIFREQKKMIVYLLDVGKRVEIPYVPEDIYSLPEEIHDIEPLALPCKVIELFDKNGLPMDIHLNLQYICNQTAQFEVKKVENDVLWISLHLKHTAGAGQEISDIENELEQHEMELEIGNVIATNDESKQNFIQNHDPDSIETPPAECVFICNLCQSSFDTNQDMEMHMKLHIPRPNCQLKRMHTKLKCHTCRFCEKSFSRKSDLNRHERTHTSEKSFQCSICDAGFGRKDSLIRHTKTHKIICKFCDKNFSQATELKTHNKTHHNKKAFVCETCGKMFTRMQHLNCHLNLHTKENEYPCETCSKIFFNLNTLRKHSAIHSEQKQVIAKLV